MNTTAEAVAAADTKLTSFVLGGGCFWCLDAAYKVLRGVASVECGYAGGQADTAQYKRVCDGDTGHAEVVRITFDEREIPASVILDAYFTMHDPRQLNGQGNDIGTQYRSVMFYSDEDQKTQFLAAAERAANLWDGEIVTAFEELEEFFIAEEYHQDYFAKNPSQGYCLAVAVPKVNKVRAKFMEYAR
ncbi:peptide-methionine (S)-S-oxide reductase MsrA [Canibacter sp. lx-45]|uniref:peptide-methionine (S)-S-oxide reductase MsrA n=1 Tax=Canibacter zhuwentaonis TaxID=2837491 RepID=UPI001BDCD272|nr:peptide-methionine (S)-S-oxide reductase MsrA [Canibacter zhuwentaonis]